jgi:hypothetical protein
LPEIIQQNFKRKVFQHTLSNGHYNKTPCLLLGIDYPNYSSRWRSKRLLFGVISITCKVLRNPKVLHYYFLYKSFCTLATQAKEQKHGNTRLWNQVTASCKKQKRENTCCTKTRKHMPLKTREHKPTVAKMAEYLTRKRSLRVHCRSRRLWFSFKA